MSGVEVAGLVLAAFPLVVSALEHVEKAKKVTSIWWKFRTAYDERMRDLSLCQLQFTLNLQELLLPLLQADIINGNEHKQLLAVPGGSSWGDEHIKTALVERLGDSFKDYVAILVDMSVTITLMCKVCKVDDVQLQALLGEASKGKLAEGAASQSPHISRTQEDASFQLKRLKYALTEFKRNGLLSKLERYNGQLRKILQTRDRLSELDAGQTSWVPSIALNSLLDFWSHANRVFRLLHGAWQCKCRTSHCAILWLRHRAKQVIELEVDLMSSANALVAPQNSWARLATQIELAGKRDNLSPTVTLQSKNNKQSRHSLAVQPPSSGVAQPNQLPSRKKTVSFSLGSPQVTSMPQHMSMGSSAPIDLKSAGLCKVASAPPSNEHLGVLVDESDAYSYSVSRATNVVQMTSTESMHNILARQDKLAWTRAQRYATALSITSSHQQLYPTPWHDGYWKTTSVLFPVCISSHGQRTLVEHPYIQVAFTDAIEVDKANANRKLASLGVVLLELCFGQPLSNHPLWTQPQYAHLKDDAMIRHAVACQWSEDVKSEAGLDYAQAVHWCLHAPSITEGDLWRKAFARNVLLPLQRCYETIVPPDTSS